MNSSYYQFCDMLELKNQKEVKWMEEQLAYDKTGYPKFIADLNDGCDMSDPGFSWEFESSGKEHWLLLYTNEYLNFDRLIHLIQKYLRTFHPGDYWTFTYAITSSGTEPGDCDGGGVFITANRVEEYSGIQFVGDQAAKFEKTKAKATKFGKVLTLAEKKKKPSNKAPAKKRAKK